MQTNFIQFSRNSDFYSIRKDISLQKGKYLLEIDVFKQKDSGTTQFLYIEEKLQDVLAAIKDTVFLGKVIKSNKYVFLFLLSSDKSIKTSIDFAMNAFQEFSYSFYITKKFFSTLEELSPSLLEIQASKNLEMLSGFDQEALYKKQKVSFFISYNKIDIFTFFLQSVKKFGYIVESDGKSPREDFEKALKISKHIYLDAKNITGATNELLTLCSDYHFLFEGWTCKPEELSSKNQS